jgi:hypothetical protein
MFPKPIIVRSEPYRRWIASLACFGCGIEGWSQCAHSNVNKSLGKKTSDLLTFPLCAPRFGLMGCHYQHDNLIGMDRETRRELELKYVDRAQQMAREAGRNELKAAA